MSMETSWLSCVAVKEFGCLNGEEKIKSLLALVKTCSYREQLEFVEALNDYLHKDFLSHLSPSLVEKVLSYLSVEDAVNCTMVSRKWNHTVGACTTFWKRKTQQLGLCEEVVQELMKTKFKSLKNLCVCALSQQTRIHSLVVHRPLVGKNPTAPAGDFLYVGHGVTLRYNELNGSALVTIERIISPHALVEIASLTVKPCSGRIKWGCASEDYVLWKQLDGKWNGYDVTNLGGELEQWMDDPAAMGFHSISFCHCCRMIAVVSEAEDDIEVWDLQVIKLSEGKASVQKVVYPLPLERILKLKKRHLLGGEVVLISSSEDRDEDCFCQSHRVCLQVDSKLVLYQLKSVSLNEKSLLIQQFLPNSQLSRPLHVLSPITLREESMFDHNVPKGRPHYCYSSDLHSVALYHESMLYVWSLDSFRNLSQVDLLQLDLPSDCKCVAVGSLYAVLASNSQGRCFVILARTGEILLETSTDLSFNYNAHNSARFAFYAPINEQWLSDVKCFDFWPIATVYDNSPKESQIKVLVGTNNRYTWLTRNVED